MNAEICSGGTESMSGRGEIWKQAPTHGDRYGFLHSFYSEEGLKQYQCAFEQFFIRKLVGLEIPPIEGVDEA